MKILFAAGLIPVRWAEGKRGRQSFLAVLIIGFAILGLAGDYQLTVSSTPESPCGPPAARAGSRDWPVVTAEALCEDIFRYFRGERTTLELFVPFFTNARITFCSQQDRITIYRCFASVLQLPNLKNVWNLYDYCYMLGSADLLKILDDELSKSLSPSVMKRLQKARAATWRGISARRR